MTIAEPADERGERVRWTVTLPVVVRGVIVVGLLELLRLELAQPIQPGEVGGSVADDDGARS